jgi:Protein of unknown function (DUF1681)
LFVEFLDKTQKDPITQLPKVYASSCIDLSSQSKNRNILNYVEQVVDSSRYYTIKIMSDTRSALIGFGFRERDDSVDFKEATQFYQNSIRRQEQAQVDASDHVSSADNSEDGIISRLAAKYVVPKLQEGEKIHINVKKTKAETLTSEGTPTPKKPASGAGFHLLKKPPPSSDPTHLEQLATTTIVQLSSVVSESSRYIEVAEGEQHILASMNNFHICPETQQQKASKEGDSNPPIENTCIGGLQQDSEMDDEEWSDFQ